LSPVINSRSADTVVVVPDGQTVIIGGLMNTQKTVSDSKIPILGDIPVLGAAFRHRTKTDVKTELMIFLTPRIVQAPAQLAGLATEERQRSTMKPKAISEEELDRFFDTLPVKDPNAPQDAAPAKNGSKSKKNHN